MKRRRVKSNPVVQPKSTRVEPIRGIECPKCGGRLLTCVYTRHKDHATVRRKRCEKCGRGVLTREVAC